MVIRCVNASPRQFETQGGTRMSQPYLGEVRLVGFTFAPADWLACNGQSLSISANGALFDLIGTTYGGDGRTVFNIPNLQGRIPIHQGSNGTSNYALGQQGGVQTVTLTIGQYPVHTHNLMASANAVASSAASNATVGKGLAAYTTDSPSSAMNAAMVGLSGNNGSHENRQPYLVLNWIISIAGIFPPPS
jgi:microcystin-dependent protein